MVISTKYETNNIRDNILKKRDSLHTFQIINIGRGSAKKVIPSVRKDEGHFLEDINPHSFSLPPNKGTEDLKEVLRVHGQRFVPGDEYGLESGNDGTTKYFYIYYEDCFGKEKYLTRVKIRKILQFDEEIWDMFLKEEASVSQKNPLEEGIEVWKIMDNEKVNGG